MSFEERNALKDHLFVDFLSEMTLVPLELDYVWVIFTDISSNSRGSSVSVILENEYGFMVEVSLRFKFSTTSNQFEYEAIITGIILAEEMAKEHIKLGTDSKLIFSQIRVRPKLKIWYCNCT